IWNTYKDWVKSYRDLPLLINQWCNVVRWEMRTRLFLRTAEFLWQEGHTAHASSEEAVEETKKMLGVYATFAEEYMALPVIRGVKTESERFAGAVDTYCIEALMQDGKALQTGTSHFLGQNFAKAFDVKFLSKENKLDYVWATSWGVSTRLVGGMVMAHSDDQGLVMPPKIAPLQVVIIPVYKGDEKKQEINVKAREIMEDIKILGISVKFDDSDNTRPGWKFAEYEMKGVPVRLAIGARDLEKSQIEVTRRDTGEKKTIGIGGIAQYVDRLLIDIQQNLFNKAKAYQQEHITPADSWSEFEKLLEEKGGFILAHWDGTAETESLIKEKTKATIRCIPLDNPQEAGKCILTGKPSQQRVLFARAY
ncbi:MAG: proline--tRNA ligase, partial [Sphingobacteriales bacterium UTBCD1]